ncbi:MAG: hypothetical protein KKG99_07430 [Bacteroidetes bacterium]|nr:hypothetical protein [Bacteroidota bacterium]
MKKRILIGCLLLMAAITINAQQTDFPKLNGPYLGQKPPGIIPEIFAPGIVSVENSQDWACTFSPDGKEFYFTRGGTIMYCRFDGKEWGNPVRAPFDSDYLDVEPHITADGMKLFWGSKRPKPGNNEKKPAHTWMIEKEGDSWSEPKYVGQGTQVSSTWDGKLYITDDSESGKGYLSKVTLINGSFVKYERLLDGIEKLRPTYQRIAHPCIALDESYIIFDVKGGSYLFVSFKNSNGKWGEPIDLTEHGFDKTDGIASLSPDGKYLFFGRGNSADERDIYWVSAKIIENLYNEAIKDYK